MIKATGMRTVLSSALGDGVEHVLLLTVAGAVISTASTSLNFATSPDQDLLVAVAANLWRTYSSNDLADDASAKPNAPSLEVLLVNYGEQRICMVSVGTTGILCLSATQAVEAGLLRLKASSLQQTLCSSLEGVLQLHQ